MDVAAWGPIGSVPINPAPSGAKAGGFETMLGAMAPDAAVAASGNMAVEAQPGGSSVAGLAFPAMPGVDLSLSAAQLPAAATKVSLLASAAAVGSASPSAVVAEMDPGGAVPIIAEAPVPLVAGVPRELKANAAEAMPEDATEGSPRKGGEDGQTDLASLAASLLPAQPDGGRPSAQSADAPVEILSEAMTAAAQLPEDTEEDVQPDALVSSTALLSNDGSLTETLIPVQPQPQPQPQPQGMEQVSEEHRSLAAVAEKPGNPAAETVTTSSTPAEASAEPTSQPFANLARSAAAEQPQANAAALPGTTSSALPPTQLAAQPAVAANAPAQPQPVMQFRADKVAREMGLEIARRVSTGGEELVIRLDPGELGRINIRMAVNEHGQLRAIVAADAPAVLEALRSDISELNRALEQAGVRTDSQSFRFDRGSSGDSGGQWQQRYQQQASGRHSGTGEPVTDEDSPAYRPMSTNGRVNMMA